MLWVFFSLACIELVAVHLFVALRWPLVGWPLSALSLGAIVWLIGWIRSWRRLPHRLSDGVLTLHMGSLRSAALPLASIAAITPVAGERLKAGDTANFVPLAYPNRIVELREPHGPKARMRYAIRVDDPDAFDAALAAALAQRGS